MPREVPHVSSVDATGRTSDPANAPRVRRIGGSVGDERPIAELASATLQLRGPIRAVLLRASRAGVTDLPIRFVPTCADDDKNAPSTRPGQGVDVVDHGQTARSRRPGSRRDTACSCAVICTASTCGAEHGRRVWKHLYDPRTWWPVVPGVTPHRQDLGVVEVIVIVVPIALPWSGEDADLSALCMGCYFTREVDRARFHSSGRHKRKAQRRLFEC